MIKEYGLYVSNWNCIQTSGAALAKVEFAVLLIFCSASFLYYLWLFNYKCLRPIPFVSHEVTNNNFKVLRDKSILLQNKRWNLQTKIESRRKNEIKKLNINSIFIVLSKITMIFFQLLPQIFISKYIMKVLLIYLRSLFLIYSSCKIWMKPHVVLHIHFFDINATKWLTIQVHRNTIYDISEMWQYLV